MTYRRAVIKRKVEEVLMFPFVIAGKLAGLLFPLKTKHPVFLFFPSADIGGSIKVNADITQCIKDKKPLIIFSKRPKNNEFRELFDIEGVRTIDLSRYIDHKIIHFMNFFFRGVLAAWINNTEKPVVFGGEGLFFYKVIPHLKKSSTNVELCHLNTWFNFSQAYIPLMHKRIFSTPKIKRDVEQQYTENGIPVEFLSRLYFIDNKIDIPEYTQVSNEVLQILFVGRGAPQKRIHLIAAIAKELYARKSLVHFSFVGNVESFIPKDLKQSVTLYGNIKEEEKLHDIYMRSDVLILTSAYEGLPIVVMEMMARGKVVISTAVDGIPDYITHLENGLLIKALAEEDIIRQGIILIENLLSDPGLKKVIGKNSYDYSLQHFSGERFCSEYIKMLSPAK